jgi:hypothetical protein
MSRVSVFVPVGLLESRTVSSARMLKVATPARKPQPSSGWALIWLLTVTTWLLAKFVILQLNVYGVRPPVEEDPVNVHEIGPVLGAMHGAF